MSRTRPDQPETSARRRRTIQSDTIDIGIIGCGIISEAHLDAIKEILGLKAVAASNRTESRLNRIADKYGIAHRYSDWRDLLSDSAVDAVVVCLPEGLHEAPSVEAARSGKHVLVEKPMAIDLARAESMNATARETGTVLMVAQVVRFIESHVTAKKWIREGRIGQILEVERRRIMTNTFPDLLERPWVADPDLSGDWLIYGFGSHEYDALLWLFDARARSVSARGTKTPSCWPGWHTISSRVSLDNGIDARVELSLHRTTADWQMSLRGSEGRLELTRDRLVLTGVCGEETRFAPDIHGAFVAQMNEFADCIRQGRSPGPSGDDVRHTMALLEAVGMALENGQPVQVP